MAREHGLDRTPTMPPTSVQPTAAGTPTAGTPTTQRAESSASSRMDYLFYLFTVLTRYRDSRLDETLKPLNLNVSRHRALGVIEAFEPCTMKELAEFSCVDRTTMTRTVDQLAADKLVERTTPPQDRRQVLLTITPHGRKMYQAALGAISAVNTEVLAGVPDEARRVFVRSERTMIGNLIPDEDLLRRLITLQRTPA